MQHDLDCPHHTAASFMNSPSSNFFRLSSGQFAEQDRIEAAREIIGRSLMKMRFELRPDVPFNVDMVFRALPDLVLASGTCSAMDCLRTPDLIEDDAIILTVALSGDSILHVRGREIPIGRNTAALTRTADVCRCEIQSASDVINFRFPFNKIAPLITDLDAAVMRPIPVNTEALRLLVHYAAMLKEESGLTEPHLQSLMASHLQDLAVLAIGATRDAAAVAGGRGVPAARLRAIKADIVRNLTDRHLSIDAVAQRHGIAPGYVSMLFDGDATTFSEFVLVQRLNRVYRMLTDPRFSDRTVSSLAFETGFGDLSYFNRSFRRLYGATPSDVRANSQSRRPN
jgi:AraC-like DNA-binding protein